MIVLDSSILVGIIKGEEDVEPQFDLLVAEDCAIGAPTLVETRAWCAINLATRSSRWLEQFIDSAPVSVIPFSRDMADVASKAFARFGMRSGHPARLNFGDCMAYAVSAVMRAPYRRINQPRPEERALARVSKDRANGHPSRRRFAPPQDEVWRFKLHPPDPIGFMESIY